MPKIKVPESPEAFEVCLQSLSPTEREILFMMLKGLAVTQIASLRDCTLNVVYRRRSAAYRKFGFYKKEGSYYEEYRQPIADLFQQYASDAVHAEIWGDVNDHPGEIYVSRSDLQSKINRALQEFGSLVRLRGAKHVGKTFLHHHVLRELSKDAYDCVPLSFQEADSHVFQDLTVFLQWFCREVSYELDLSDAIDQFWDEGLSPNTNATRYFEQTVLKERKKPLVLALDDMDRVFNQKAIANDFCGLLRNWYDKARRGGRFGPRWKQHRLLIIHSTEIYAELDINQSPLSNVGLVLPVEEFTAGQIAELARQNQVPWDDDCTQQLMTLIGGHPALAQTTFDHIKDDLSLDDILKDAPTEASIYGAYLRGHRNTLNASEQLAADFKAIIDSDQPIQVSPSSSFQLQSMGLTRLHGNVSSPRNKLYRQYFKDRLPI